MCREVQTVVEIDKIVRVGPGRARSMSLTSCVVPVATLSTQSSGPCVPSSAVKKRLPPTAASAPIDWSWSRK